MTRKFSFLIELAKQKFDEVNGSTASWMMAMPIGTYQHPVYGKINLTPDRIQRFADNVNNGIRGQDIDIDYDHKEYGGQAAGWVKQADARSDGLWLLVEWTTKAFEEIKSKAYRYFSPEFEDTWTDPRNGVKFKDVLLGGGITNRPFLKGIQPLNLSEFYSDTKVALKENGSMDPDQIRELAAKLGLGDNATPEMLFGALMMKLGGGDSKPEPPKPGANKPEPTKPADGAPAQNNENGGGMTQQYTEKQLSETPLVKKLTEQLELQSKKFAEMALTANLHTLTEVATKKNIVLSEPVTKGITKLLSESHSDEYTAELVKTLSEILTNAGPAGGELGSQSKRLTDAEGDNVKKFSDKVKKLMEDEKLSYADAAVRAAAADEETFENYRQDSYLQEGE